VSRDVSVVLGVPARLVVLLLALAACQPSGPDPAGGAPLVPLSEAVPPQLRPFTGSPAPPCRSAQLAVVGAGFAFTPAAAGGTGEVRLHNTSQSACRLTGRPDVHVVGAVPAPQQRTTAQPAEPPRFPSVVAPESVLLALPPGADAVLAVDWRNWCVPPTTGAPRPPRAIQLDLPDGGGSIDVNYNAVPACEAPADATSVGVRPFQPAPLPSTPPWTSTALQATIAPVTARRGETVQYVVELHNPSAVPVSFATCPLLVQMLAPAGRPEARSLNCADAGSLPAGGSLRFAMRIQVPPDAPAGRNGLFWELDPTGMQGPLATTQVTVS
jgi:hypothetical protein